MFRPDDLPAGVRDYHGPPNLAEVSLPEYYPLSINTKMSEEIRLNSHHSRQSGYVREKRLAIDQFKANCSKRFI